MQGIYQRGHLHRYLHILPLCCAGDCDGSLTVHALCAGTEWESDCKFYASAVTGEDSHLADTQRAPGADQLSMPKVLFASHVRASLANTGNDQQMRCRWLDSDILLGIFRVERWAAGREHWVRECQKRAHSGASQGSA